LSIEIQGILSRIIYQNQGFTIAEFIQSQTAERFRVKGPLTTLGKHSLHQTYHLMGHWQEDLKYGKTFILFYGEPQRPDSLEGIIPFLSNNIKGMGEVTAEKFLSQLSINSLLELNDLCQNQSQKVFNHFKNKPDMAQSVIDLFTLDIAYRSIMVFLHEHEIPTHFAKKIYQQYGYESILKLQENPYRLIGDFKSMGFLKADSIARKLGLSPTSPFRIEASIQYVLDKAQDNGDCYLPIDTMIERALKILNNETVFLESSEVLNSLRQSYKNQLDSSEKLFSVRKKDNDSLFYLPVIYKQEDEVTRICLEMHQTQFPPVKEKLSDLQKQASEIPWDLLSPEQSEAVKVSISSSLMILTGGPGCGKTFVLKAIYAIQQLLQRKVVLCAPTGLAAKRMTQSIGAKAYTLHKLLHLQNDDSHPSELHGVDTVIVDESSMLSLDLLHSLLQAMGKGKRLILVGDSYQLPSIGAGNCLRDLIDSEKFPVIKLQRIFRQASHSPIPLAAQQILEGRSPEFSYIGKAHTLNIPESLGFIPSTKEDFFDELKDIMTSLIPKVYSLNPVEDVQILIPLRKGPVGQEATNTFLQNLLNPLSTKTSLPEIKLFNGQSLRVGDKVIQTKNNYEKMVFNGDLGYCLSIDSQNVTIQFDDQNVTFKLDELGDLQLCYSMTIHKSQGSEFPLVVIPIFSSYFMMLNRNLIYTALTRAKKAALFVGEKNALHMGLRNIQATQRYTSLKWLLQI